MNVDPSRDVDFSLDNSRKAQLNVSREHVVSADSMTWSINRHVSKVVVFTRQKHLQKVLEWKSSIVIAIEKSYKLVKFWFSDMMDLIVSEKVQELKWVYIAWEVPVNSLECAIWREISDSAEPLPCIFKFSLAISNGY
mgnify:CR=1 FL=1